MKTPNLFTLTAKTRHGKNSMQVLAWKHPEFSGDWVEKDRREKVQFSRLRGPWLFLQPDVIGGDSLARWVHLGADPNFTVTQL